MTLEEKRYPGDPLWPTPLMRNCWDALADEIVRARTKFPSNMDLGMALVEEVGELFEELVVQEPTKRSRERRRAEALQVACVAMRIFEEEDPLFDCHPTENGSDVQHRSEVAAAVVAAGRWAKMLLEEHPIKPKE